MSQIHSTAIISPNAVIEEGVNIGPYCVIGEKVYIKSGTSIGAHSIIEHTTLGRNCSISSHVVIGLAAQDFTYQGEDTSVEIDDDVVIREFSTIHRGTIKGKGKTVIGNKCYIMNYAHIGHDCHLSSEIILTNNATLAGHVSVGEKANLGAFFTAHQFVRIGDFSMGVTSSNARLDIPPFTMVAGYNSKVVWINSRKLRKEGFSAEKIRDISKAYKVLKKKNNVDALAEIESWYDSKPNDSSSSHLQKIVDFYRNSKSGVTSFFVARD